MKLILRETIDTLGEEGDIVKVKPGYGRNYLVPRQKASLATPGNIAVLEKQRAAIAARKAEQRKGAEALAKKIAGATVTIAQRTGEDDKLYGSVTGADIAAALKALGVAVDRKKIVLDEPIKTLGSHLVPYKAGYQVTAEIKVEVVPLAAEQPAAA